MTFFESRPRRAALAFQHNLRSATTHKAAHNRRQAALARNDMRTWQVEHRKRTRHLIELGGLVVKAGLVDLTNDDRTTIYGALLWIAAKLQRHEGDDARDLWAVKGKQAFDAERHDDQKSAQT